MSLFDTILNDKEIINRYKEIEDFEHGEHGGAHHNLAHVLRVAEMAEDILKKLRYNDTFIEEVKIAALLHDVGANIGKENHAIRSYEFACDYFKRKNIKLKYPELVLEAIKIHNNGFDSDNLMVLILILCDKLDVKKERLTPEFQDVEGLRQFSHVDDIKINFKDDNMLEINIITDNNLDLEELENYYFIQKIFKAIKAFSTKLEFVSIVKIDGKLWKKYLETFTEKPQYTDFGMNLNTKKILFNDYDIIDPESYGKMESVNIINEINTYTKLVEWNIFVQYLLKLMAKIEKIDITRIKYNKEKQEYEYTTQDGEVINFDIISNYLKEANDEIRKELRSSEREDKCHKRSIEVAGSSQNTKILTGIIKFGYKKVLHSVVEIVMPKSQKTKIIDWTRNIVIDKDEYIRLFEFTILNEVEGQNIKADYELIERLSLGALTDKEYLTFRDEIFRDLSKNEFLYSEEDKKL